MNAYAKGYKNAKKTYKRMVVGKATTQKLEMELGTSQHCASIEGHVNQEYWRGYAEAFKECMGK